jgi:hypothetical protein
MKNDELYHDDELQYEVGADQNAPESNRTEIQSSEVCADKRACVCCEKGVLYYTDTGSEEAYQLIVKHFYMPPEGFDDLDDVGDTIGFVINGKLVPKRVRKEFSRDVHDDEVDDDDLDDYDPIEFVQIATPRAYRRRKNLRRWESNEDERRGRLVLIGSGGGRDGSTRIDADMDVYSSLVSEGEVVSHLSNCDRRVWVQVIDGQIECNGQALYPGRATLISNASVIQIRGVADESEILVMDMCVLNEEDDCDGADEE